MYRKLTPNQSGLSQSTWPLVLLLLIVVAAPATAVLWFMTQAIRNEQLAVRAQMETLYRGQLRTLAKRLDHFWEQQVSVLAQAADSEDQPAEIFAKTVRTGLVDSLIVSDSDANILYPTDTNLVGTIDDADLDLWLEAWELEHQSRDDAAAIAAYSAIADDAIAEATWNTAAAALLGQARCLVRSGDQPAALEIVRGDLSNLCGSATDQQGNLILPNAQLWALQSLVAPESTDFRSIFRNLMGRLNDYGGTKMPANQRRFLMNQLTKLSLDPILFPTFQAELIAGQVLDHPQFLTSIKGNGKLVRANVEQIWIFADIGEKRPVMALYHEADLQKRMQAFLEVETLIPDATLTLTPSGLNKTSSETPLVSEPASQYLPGWHLSLSPDGPDSFDSMANGQIVTYFYGGISVVLITIVTGGFVARHVSSQIRTTRLRNDLIATVTHELKTPLTSMRALIETLLEGRYRDDQQQQEYLQLAAKENERLSRLIDNFLAFSRMERDRETFECAEIEVTRIVNAAVEVVAERFEASGSRLDVTVAAGLPAITGDAEALVTVLVNLLDNAQKYTENDKQISLSVSCDHGQVRLAVKDNGIGLSNREAKNVFDRFYQVDQSLTRRVSGCGLGLSIVQFIVKAHRGSVSVSSQLGRGSTFTVTLPAAEDPPDQNDGCMALPLD